MPELLANTVQLHPYRLCDTGVEHLVLRRAVDEPVYPGIWQVITGQVEPGESTAAAARRELVEETGLDAVAWDFLPDVVSFYFHPADRIYLAPVVACELRGDDRPGLSSEHDEHRWLAATDACALLEFPSHRCGVALVDAWVRERGGR